MKIALLGTYNQSEILTGPEKFAKRLAHELATEHNVIFYSYFQDGKDYSFYKKLFGYENILQEKNLTVVRVGMITLIQKLIRSLPDVCHSVTFERFAVIALLLKVFVNLKIIYTAHGNIAHEVDTYNETMPCFLKAKNKVIEFCFLKYSNRVCSVSEILANSLGKKYRKVLCAEIIPNGIDTMYLPVGGESNNRKFDVAFIGEFSRAEKGFKFFFESISLINQKLEVLIIGNGYPAPYHKNNFTIQHKVSADELYNLLLQSKIYVSASKYETFSIAAFEAMACGCVPIVTSSTGMHTYIDEGTNGFVVEFENKEKLASIILKLITNQELCAAVSQKAQQTALKYSWKNIASMYVDVYKNCKNIVIR